MGHTPSMQCQPQVTCWWWMPSWASFNTVKAGLLLHTARKHLRGGSSGLLYEKRHGTRYQETRILNRISPWGILWTWRSYLISGPTFPTSAKWRVWGSWLVQTVILRGQQGCAAGPWGKTESKEADLVGPALHTHVIRKSNFALTMFLWKVSPSP